MELSKLKNTTRLKIAKALKEGDIYVGEIYEENGFSVLEGNTDEGKLSLTLKYQDLLGCSPSLYVKATMESEELWGCGYFISYDTVNKAVLAAFLRTVERGVTELQGSIPF